MCSMLLLARLLDDEKHCSCCSITVTGGLPVGAGGCCRCDLLVCCLWREIIVVLVWILVLRVLVSSWSKVLYYVAYSSMRVNVIRATGTCLIGLNGLIFLFYGICLCKYNIPHPPVLVFRCSVSATQIFATKKGSIDATLEHLETRITVTSNCSDCRKPDYDSKSMSTFGS
jgi:hypothetical protein